MCHKRKAFTLIEILAVTVIIALLVAILVPTVEAMRRRAKTVLCANNLKRISQAVSTRRLDELQKHVIRLSVPDWRVDLAPYLSVDPNSLICKEYYSEETPRVAETYRFHLTNYADVDYFIELDDPSVIKMSETQFRQARDAGYPSHAAFADYTEYQGYVPDEQANVVWYLMEESTAEHDYGTWDHEDIRMRVTDNGDGTSELYYERGSTVVIIEVVPVDGGKPVTTFYPGATPPPPVTVAGGGMDPGSYGFNIHAGQLSGGEKILAIDYIWTTASPLHKWAGMRRGDERPDLPAFARHRGLMNAAFMDGAVRLMKPEDIDPANENVSKVYWLP